MLYKINNVWRFEVINVFLFTETLCKHVLDQWLSYPAYCVSIVIFIAMYFIIYKLIYGKQYFCPIYILGQYYIIFSHLRSSLLLYIYTECKSFWINAFCKVALVTLSEILLLYDIFLNYCRKCLIINNIF